MEWSEVIEIERTADVQSQGDFSSLMISPSILTNMKNHGFLKPSPVQQRAIPAGLSGFDMLVQAKSGTGKTLVFSILAVENLIRSNKKIQKLIVATTREIAAQISQTVKKIAPAGTRIGVFTGGTSVNNDRIAIQNGVSIAVGTSGRLCQLVNDGIMSLASVDLFVLDEADQLMSESFHKDINFLFSSLPVTKQVCVFSATYPSDMDTLLAKYMKAPCLVRLNADNVQLIGVNQYVLIRYAPVLDTLIDVIKRIQFTQALVFCNLANDCEAVCEALCALGLDAIFISSQKEQNERNAVIARLTKNTVKVLVSTDLTARGIDATNVNLVINIEPAVSCETYLHRIGRTARYGGLGAALTILSDNKMCSRFCALVRDGAVKAKIIPNVEAIPSDITTNKQFFDDASPYVVEEQRPVYKKKEFVKRDSGFIIDKMKNKKTWLDDVVPKDPTYVPPSSKAGIWTYDHDQMIELRVYCGPVSGELALKLDNLELSRGSNFNRELAELTEDLKRLRELGPPEDSQQKPEHAKFPKFVPSRLKNRKKFYLRGEMLRILEGIQPKVWTKFAASKFNLNEDPFLPEFASPSDGKNNAQGLVPGSKSPTASTKALSLQPSDDTPPSTSSPSPGVMATPNQKTNVVADDVPRYKRKDMIAISKSKSSQEWREYVTSHWDTAQDPFEMNPQMRCSFEEQLRRQRQKEKNLRFKVIEDRRKAVQCAPKIVNSGRTPVRRDVSDDTWKDYTDRILKETDPEQDENTPTKFVPGPVIAPRMAPNDFLHEVSYWGSWLERDDANFRYNIQKYMGKRVETCTSTDELPNAKDVEQLKGYDPEELMRRLQIRDDQRATEDQPTSSTSGVQSGVERQRINSDMSSELHPSSEMVRMVDDIVRTDAENDDYQDTGPHPIYQGVIDSSSSTSSNSENIEAHPAVVENSNQERIDSFAQSVAYNMNFANVMNAYLNTAANSRPPFE